MNFNDKLILIGLNWIVSANCGYEESRREQARLHEELALREKALRDTRIRNIPEVEELKRAQEMRVDEFSVQKIERKSCYDARAHFADTGISRKGDFLSGFKRISRCRGSSASKMTSSKVMDVISRLPGCAGPAADAISAYTQVKIEDAPSLLKFQVRMSRYVDTSTKTQMAEIMVHYGRSALSFRAKSVRSSTGRTIMGKASQESSFYTMVGKSFQFGNACL